MKELLLEWIPWGVNKTISCLEFSKRVALAAYTEATVEKEWLFLHSVQIPVSSMIFPNIVPEQIQWRVKLYPTRFTNIKSSEYKHMPYLGMTLYLSENIINLTDWINEVKWSGTTSPTLKELFIIWCCETGSSYLHLIPIAEVEIITENGDTVRTTILNDIL